MILFVQATFNTSAGYMPVYTAFSLHNVIIYSTMPEEVESEITRAHTFILKHKRMFFVT